jgi:hypothetical protein
MIRDKLRRAELVENPRDTARARIDLDAVAVDERDPLSAPLLSDERAPRHDLAGRDRARVTGTFLRRSLGRSIWTRPGG